ncbi:MAG: rhomboid family intramembrane serine protease [Hyphomicrobium sp.]
MFVPIGDDNPLKSIRFQYVTLALIVANVLAFLFETMAVSTPAVVASFAVVPQELFQVALLGGAAPISGDAIAIPERATLFSYMFLHGDGMHLIGNMLFLWVFGDNVEDAMGHVRFLVFYLTCGIVAGLTHAVMMSDSQDALIGASGAVSGVISAYLMLHPRVRVWVLALKVIPLRISAAMALGLWIVFQLVMVVFPQAGPTAWWAHIGGLAAGALLIPIMKRPGVPLFQH